MHIQHKCMQEHCFFCFHLAAIYTCIVSIECAWMSASLCEHEVDFFNAQNECHSYTHSTFRVSNASTEHVSLCERRILLPAIVWHFEWAWAHIHNHAHTRTHITGHLTTYSALVQSMWCMEIISYLFILLCSLLLLLSRIFFSYFISFRWESLRIYYYSNQYYLDFMYVPDGVYFFFFFHDAYECFYLSPIHPLIHFFLLFPFAFNVNFRYFNIIMSEGGNIRVSRTHF